jgi:general secretion pathway protein H
VPVKWHPQAVNNSGKPSAFVFEGLPPQTLSELWLSPQIQVASTALVVLGPDPIIGPQSVALRVKDLQLWVSTDGLRPFSVKRAAP